MKFIDFGSDPLELIIVSGVLNTLANTAALRANDTSKIIVFFFANLYVIIRAIRIPGIVKNNIWGAVTNPATLNAIPYKYFEQVSSCHLFIMNTIMQKNIIGNNCELFKPTLV